MIAQNKSARHDYHILETIEAGIELKGTEVKSLRAGQVSLKDGFARVEANQILLYNMHISPYEFGNIANVDPMRPRRLLLHRNQIKRFTGQLTQKGFTLVPLKAYLKHGRIKIELGLAKGKRLYDKRDAMKKHEASREMQRALREKNR